MAADRTTSNQTPRSYLRRWLRGALWAGLLLTITLSALAGERVELYETELTVAGQDDEARNQAQRAALAEVVVRASGRRDVVNEPAVVALIEEAPRYVQQYRYLTAPAEEEGAVGGLRLWVRFDSEAINRQLGLAGIALWGNLRPTLLAWIAYSASDGRYLVGGEQGQRLRELLEHAARRRGTPLLFPLLDLEDQARVRHTDLWAGFHQPAITHASRYAPDGVVIIRIEALPDGRWRGRLSLHLESPLGEWLVESATIDQLANELVDLLADRLAGRFALPTANAAATPTIELQIDGVSTLADYARVERYLSALPVVVSLQLVESSGQQLLFQLTLRGDREAVSRAIALGHTLERLTDTDMGDQNRLDYRLRP